MLKNKLTKIQKEKKISRDTLFEIFIDYLSYFILLIILKTKIFTSPNQITTFGLFLGLSSIYNFNNENILLGSLLLTFFIILDFVDGDFARIKKMSSQYGKKLDRISDRIILILIFYTNYNLIDQSIVPNLILIFLSIIPIIPIRLFNINPKNLKGSHIESKIQIVLNLKKIFNFIIRPTFTNIICLFIISTNLGINFFFLIFICVGSSLLIIKNLK